uniref:NMDA receptor synaptonuclear signaling and neuronal migration factor-like n=1 Tax=Gouania willdenowi TaxID=441366 RepID=A0A8C5DT02_GOUWI
MGTAASKGKNLRNDAISSVAAKVRAARAFGEHLSNTHSENRIGSDQLLCETLVAPDCDSPRNLTCQNNNHLCSYSCTKSKSRGGKLDASLLQAPPPAISLSTEPASLSLEHSFSAEEDQQKCIECTLQPARVYTITTQHGMLMSSCQGGKESLELDVLKENGSQQQLTAAGPSSHHGPHQHAHHHHHLSQPPLQTSVSAHNIRSWGDGGKWESDCSALACDSCSGAPSRSQGSLDLESASREAGKQHRRLERMWSVDRMTGLERDDTNWFPKENMFSFQTATTTMQARVVGSIQCACVCVYKCVCDYLLPPAPAFAERRSKSFSRSWSDPTPVKTDSPNEPRDSGDLQTSCGTLDEGGLVEGIDWEEEREMERLACEGDDFIPPKIMLISSKVPKAEYVPTIIRRDDPSIIPILYDHEHATFDDILEEIEKKLTAYRRGSKFWRMLIFCQGGPGHLYLLKNKVATFAKVEKEEDMSQFWRRLSRFMSKVNPEPNLIHIMGCYVLGNPNGEKLFQKLKNLMRPYSVEFESPLELSAQGKEMIEMYFDFRLYRLWKTRQHSKLLDYEDLL